MASATMTETKVGRFVVTEIQHSTDSRWQVAEWYAQDGNDYARAQVFDNGHGYYRIAVYASWATRNGAPVVYELQDSVADCRAKFERTVGVA